MILQVDNKNLLVNGKFPRIIRLEAEYYEWVNDPYKFLDDVKCTGATGDLFTFVQKLNDEIPRYGFYLEWDSIAILRISTYEDWWKKQINDKTRNMIRRAQKSGVDVRLVQFNDAFIGGVKDIYDESPLRQGKPFRHYKKSLQILTKEHSSFMDRSQFIGAFYKGELIGFVKLVHDDGVSHLMQIISKMEHRDKAPTNALLAKSVEICADQGVHFLHYSTWSRRGLGDFKKHHAFEQFEVPRYFIPLNLRGKLSLRLRLHREFSELLPQKWVDVAVDIRNKWNTVKFNFKKF
jgi:hypothetical protein